MTSTYTRQAVIACLFILIVAPARGEAEAILPPVLDGGPREEMMTRYLLARVDAAWEQWKHNYEARTDPAAIAAYQGERRRYLLNAIGGLPERTPLNPRVTGTRYRDGYRVELVMFESQPGHVVTGNVYVPESSAWQPPYPAVLVPCGHYIAGKAAEEYQAMGALLALNGMVALVFDPIDQGERIQLSRDFADTRGHMMIAVGSILLGRNTATFEVHDALRALDYVVSRPEVDPRRVGCTGNSGGGTQTTYLTVLDERIRVAAVSCYHHIKHVHVRGPFGDAENAIFGQLTIPMEPADYLMLRAPEVKTLVCAATEDFLAIDATWTLYRYAKRLYTRLDFPERLAILENDAPHNYNRTQRQSVVRWMARWLQQRDEPIQEPPLDLFEERELYCTPTGAVTDLEGYRSTYILNAEYNAALAVDRCKLWRNATEALGAVRALTGIRALPELPSPIVNHHGTRRRDGMDVEDVVLEPEHGIYLPARFYSPEVPTAAPVLYLHEACRSFLENGDERDKLRQWLRAGRPVLALDCRGMGETRNTVENSPFPFLGSDYKDVYIAYLLGYSYVAMRAEDILIASRYLAERAGTDQIILHAAGAIGVPALHAAALEPQCYASVELVETLQSWTSVVEAPQTRNQLANTVHGALRIYDLPDLVTTLGTTCTVTDSRDALDNAVTTDD